MYCITRVRAFWVELEIRCAGFGGEGKTGVTRATSVGGECSHHCTSPGTILLLLFRP